MSEQPSYPVSDEHFQTMLFEIEELREDFSLLMRRLNLATYVATGD